MATVNTSYSSSLQCDTRSGLSVGLTLLALLVTAAVFGVLAYKEYISPTVAYSAAPPMGVAFIVLGTAIAFIRKNATFMPTVEPEDPLTLARSTPVEASVTDAKDEQKVMPDETLEEGKAEKATLNVGMICPTSRTYAVTEKIVLSRQELHFLGLFPETSPHQQEKIASLTLQLQTNLQLCDMSDEKQVDEELKKIFNAENLMTSDGGCASMVLVLNNKIYSLSIGVGFPHLTFVTWRNPDPFQEYNGCYEVSGKKIEKKRENYLSSYGHLDVWFPDNVTEEITEESNRLSIYHLPKREPHEKGSSYHWSCGPTCYQEGDYLILGCSDFWRTHGLKECFERIKEMDEKGKKPQEMAVSLATDQETVIVFKLGLV